MPKGFFSASTLAQSREPALRLPRCGECGLYRDCRSPKLPYAGKGCKGILVVADQPEDKDDATGRLFSDTAGELLRRELARLDVDLDRDCWQTNALICHSKDDPTNNQVDWCRPNLLKTIKETQPSKILLFGGAAVRSLVGHLWKDDPGGIERWAGWRIPAHEPNAWVCPTFHPSALFDAKTPVVSVWFRRHLEQAIELEGRPWPDGPPDYASQVECILDTDKAAAIIRKMIEKGGMVAVDYETNMLKPDSPKSRIVCCSVCWQGKKTIAFPWHGAAIEAMRELLQSDLKKITCSQKFEARWSTVAFGEEPRNMAWDTLLAAHHLDNRSDIVSIKFQAFVRLGQVLWNRHIDPFFESNKPGSYSPNRIDEIDLMQLLRYCGMDSLLEYKVAELQMKECGL